MLTGSIVYLLCDQPGQTVIYADYLQKGETSLDNNNLRPLKKRFAVDSISDDRAHPWDLCHFSNCLHQQRPWALGAIVAYRVVGVGGMMEGQVAQGWEMLTAKELMVALPRRRQDQRSALTEDWIKQLLVDWKLLDHCFIKQQWLFHPQHTWAGQNLKASACWLTCSFHF